MDNPAVTPEQLRLRLEQEEASLAEFVENVNRAIAIRTGKIAMLKELLGLNDGN